MHPETIRELVDAVATAGGAVVKDTIVRRQELNSHERMKEMEVELAKARREHGNPEPRAHPEPKATPSVGAGADLSAAFADLKAQENCQTCLDLLEAIEAAPHDQQVRALAEWGRFKHAVERGESEAELREVLESSDVLVGLLDTQLSA